MTSRTAAVGLALSLAPAVSALAVPAGAQAATTTTTATTQTVVPAPLSASSTSLATTTGATTTGGAGGLDKTPCIYPSNSIGYLDTFQQMVGRSFNCVLLYNDSPTTWAQWDYPWFIGGTYADNAWKAWATAAGTHRRLIIDENLFPSSAQSDNWLAQGAAGAYESYAKTLAANLVAAGLGSSVIRLGHEANGNWYADSIPNTTTGDAQWVQFWDNTVTAMRSVPGANFQFDWTINAGWRNIPFSEYYPGNAYVDIIGIDAYDNGTTITGSGRWSAVYNRGGGLAALQAFAAAQGKPLSIGEWGIGPAQNPTEQFAGDDPAYVNGIAGVVNSANVAYQSYFLAEDEGPQLEQSPQSLAAYVSDFGAQGTSTLAADAQTVLPPASPAPSLTMVSGPANGGTATSNVSFGFLVPAGNTVQCSLDGAAFAPCTSYSTDVHTGLASGYHFWRVEAFDNTNHYLSLTARAFVVSGS